MHALHPSALVRIFFTASLIGLSARAQTAPAIVTAPASLTEVAGNNVLFSVTAGGTAPLGYAWSFNGRPITGATAGKLFLPVANPSDAGNYTVTITNPAGSVTSPAATLTVLPSGATNGIDATFTPTPPPQDGTKILVEQPDGKLLVVANFNYLINSFAQKAIARLNRDGSLDPTFKPGNDLNSDNVTSLALQADGRILVTGSFTSIAGVARSGFARLNADASLDLSFVPASAIAPSSRVVGLQPDAKIIVATSTGLYRLRPDGALDSPGPILALDATYALAPDGKILALSTYRRSLPVGPLNPGTFIHLARYNPDGSPDPNFSPTDILADASPIISLSFPAFRVIDDGRVVFAFDLGLNPTNPSVSSQALRFYADGTRDVSYNLNLSRLDLMHNAPPPVISISGDGQLTLGRTEGPTVVNSYLRRYDAAGMMNYTFSFYTGNFIPSQFFSTVLSLRSGEIIAAGNFVPPAGPVTDVRLLVRLTTFRPNAPAIASLPLSTTVNAGEPVSLRLTLTGTAPFSISVNGGPVTSNSTGLIDLGTPDAQQDTAYRVTATNASGTVTSSPITVHVVPSAPIFTTQPQNVSVISAYTPGATVTFASTVRGTEPLAYQWAFNGTPLSGATTASLTLAATSETAGSYALTVTNSVGQTTGRSARLSVEPGSRISNLASRGFAGTGEDVLIAGFAITGSAPKPMLIRAAGPALTKFFITAVLADPQLTVYDSAGAIVAQNDDWGTAFSDNTTFDRLGAFRFDPGSHDAALLVTLAPGSYTAIAANRAGGTGVALIEAYAADASAPRLVNLSSRLLVGTGEQIGIPGIVVRGAASKKLLIRGIGPTLAGFNIKNPLADPVLTLIGPGNTIVATNDKWSSSANAAEIVAAATSSGAFPLPLGSKDAAVLVTLPPGSYTALISGANATGGVALLEVYEVPK
jgi:uncharacterized delta-60 repeat protein